MCAGAQPLPILMPIPQAMAVSGLRKTTLHNRMKKRLIVAHKVGSRTMVETESLLKFIENLPCIGDEHDDDTH
jgi:hypothetical protein